MISVLGLVLVFFIVYFLYAAIKIVPQQHAWVVERLGRYSRTLNAGLNILVPLLERVAYRHDLREVPLNVAPQVCITKDNTQVTVDGVLYFQITDPKLASYGSSNPIAAAVNLAQTTMRSAIGELTLDDTLSSREALNAKIVVVLDEAAGNWGIKVLRYVIKDITPPEGILRSMEMQIKAERERRAVVLASEAQKTQDINVSEGQRQREINLAEGVRQARILQAQGEAEALRLVATGTAQAIESVATALRAEHGTAALQLQVARDFIAQWGKLAKESNTVIIPAEMGNIAGLVSSALQIIKAQQED